MNHPIMDNPRPAIRKWLLIILIIVAVLGAAFFAWYYLMGSGKKVETTTTTPTTTTDETAGWKTYTNETYGYSFKYPNDTYNLTDKPSNKSFVLESEDLTNIEGTSIPLYSIGIDVEATSQKLSSVADTWLDSLNDNGTFNNSASNTTVGGVAAKKVKNYSNALGAGEYSSAIVVNNGKSYKIVFSSYKKESKFTTTVFDQILSTFKFTAPKASTTTSTDITCTNDTYGFTYTLPTDWKVCKSKEATFDGSVKTYYVQIATTDSNFATGDEIQDAGYYSPFAITVYTPAQWAAVEAEGGPAGQKITENSNYVFTWNQANGVPPSDFTEAMQNQIQDIIDSFKLK